MISLTREDEALAIHGTRRDRDIEGLGIFYRSPATALVAMVFARVDDTGTRAKIANTRSAIQKSLVRHTHTRTASVIVVVITYGLDTPLHCGHLVFVAFVPGCARELSIRSDTELKELQGKASKREGTDTAGLYEPKHATPHPT